MSDHEDQVEGEAEYEDVLYQHNPERNGDEKRKNWTVSISGVLLVLSFMILCANITYAFWADQQRRQDRVAFVNELLLANCQQDRAQDRILLNLVEAVLVRPLPPDASADQKRVRRVFQRQANALNVRVMRGCPSRILN